MRIGTQQAHELLISLLNAEYEFINLYIIPIYSINIPMQLSISLGGASCIPPPNPAKSDGSAAQIIEGKVADMARIRHIVIHRWLRPGKTWYC